MNLNVTLSVFSFSVICTLSRISAAELPSAPAADEDKTAATSETESADRQAPVVEPQTPPPSGGAPQETAEPGEQAARPSAGPKVASPLVADEATSPIPVKVEETKKPAKLMLATEDGNFTVKPLLLAQPVFVIPVDGDADHPAAGSGVMLKRARLGFDATLFKIASVKLWGDFRNGAPELVDAYVDIDPLKGNLVIRFGWYRPWFGRQRLGSSSKFQFIETAAAWSDKQLGLNLNRDMGLSLYGTVAEVFDWGIGLFNGEKSFSLGDNRDYGVAARIAVHPLSPAFGGKAFNPGDETALKGPDKPALSIGSAVSFERRKNRSVVTIADESLPYEDGQLKVGGELGFQWKRLVFLSEIFWMKTILKDDTGDDAIGIIDGMTPTAAVNGTGLGAYFQTGVMVVKDLFELAGRFDWVDEHLDTNGSRFYPAFAANLYLKGHNLKLQTFYRAEVAAGYDSDHPDWRDKPVHLIELMLQAGF